VMKAEFTKLRAVRGTIIALALFVLISVAVAALDGWSARQALETHSRMLRSGFTPEQAGLDGVLYGQVALIVFGVLVVTSEYGSGMIRLSLLAVPRRGQLYTAKMAVTALAAAIATIPATIITYATTQAALGRYGASIQAPGVPRALAGAVIYLALMCLFAAGIAVMTRNTIAPLAVLIPLVLVGSHLLSIIGATRNADADDPRQRRLARPNRRFPGAGRMGRGGSSGRLRAASLPRRLMGHHRGTCPMPIQLSGASGVSAISVGVPVSKGGQR
jgi:ABC-2 type transport system permease protein